MRFHILSGTRCTVALLTARTVFKVVVAEDALDTGLAVAVQPARQLPRSTHRRVTGTHGERKEAAQTRVSGNAADGIATGSLRLDRFERTR